MTEPGANIPTVKQTALGLYITAKEAYEQWRSASEQVMLLDVRTPEELLFVGHAPMAWKVPVAAQSYEWDAAKQQFPMRPLPDFVARVREVAQPEDTLMVMCRSGGRSAMAVNLLAQAGIVAREKDVTRHRYRVERCGDECASPRICCFQIARQRHRAFPSTRDHT